MNRISESTGGKRAHAGQGIKIPFERTQGAGWKQCELVPSEGKHVGIHRNRDPWQFETSSLRHLIQVLYLITLLTTLSIKFFCYSLRVEITNFW